MDYEKVIAERDALRQEVLYLSAEIEQLKRMIFGSKKERFVPEVADKIQLSLFEEQASTQKSTHEKEKISYERNKPVKRHPGRNEIPEHFEVEQIVIEPQQDVTGMIKIGEQITEYAVSYTHLRAHETVLDLVCRLLLEKKKKTKKEDNRIFIHNAQTSTHY